MNKCKVFLTLLFSVISITQVSAATTPNWQDIEIGAVYLKNTQEMKISAFLDGVTRISNTSYTLTLNIAGKSFFQTLQYDDAKDTLSANFVNFTKTLNKEYPFSYTIKSTKNISQNLYTASGTLIFNGNIAGVGISSNTNNGTQTGAINLTQNQRDALSIYTIVMQNIPKNITTTSAKIAYLQEVNKTLQAYALRYPTRKTVLDMAIVRFETQISAYRNPSIKTGFIPKYKTQAEEPTTINGIGNSKKKSSWRVE